jgi:phosphoribosylaminoimidazolecarboxamide formyltransferase/IMP cyclohydrolase
VGVSSNLNEAYSLALQTDPISAFGGIVAVNETVDEKTAALMSKHFFEVVMAPDFDSSALDLLKKKKNLRILRIEPGSVEKSDGFLWDVKTVEDGALIQERDTRKFDKDELKVVTAVKPTEDQRRALELAWIVAKHVKSNSIVLANDTGTLGIGAGQMSRVDSVRISIDKAKRFGLSTEGAVMASDAFFPFRDGLDESASAGVKAVIQPGGSIRDEEVIKAADEHGITMIFTGMRHFRH